MNFMCKPIIVIDSVKDFDAAGHNLFLYAVS